MKNILHIIAAGVVFSLLVACSEKLGTEPGNDPTPKATIYQYAPGEGYNSDEDVVVRFVSNGKVEKLFYLVEPADEKESFINENGEAEYAKKVLSEGLEVPSAELKSYNDTLTGLAGTYAVTAAAVSGGETILSESVFYGLSWSTLSSGTYTFAVLSDMGLAPAQTEFQVCDTDPNLYRFKDVFKPGYSLKIVALPEYTNTDDYGTYTFCRVPVQDTGFSYGDYGAIGVRDIGYWQGDASYVTDGGYESCYYTDGPEKGYLYIFVQYYVSAGNLGYDYDFYAPSAE